MTRDTRRLFLVHSASVMIAAAFTNVSRAFHGRLLRERLFKMDLRPGSIGSRLALPDSIRAAAQHGFESVNPEPGYLERLDPARRETVNDLRKELNLVWGAGGLSVDFRSDDASFRRDIPRLRREAEAMEDVGATRMGTWLKPVHDSLSYSENMRVQSRRLRECAKILKDHGLRFGLEYVGPKTSRDSARHSFVHTLAQTRELIDAINMDNVGVILDSWHWYTAHETIDDLMTLTNEDIIACDLNDAPAGIPIDEQIDNQRELPTATGVIDLKGFLTALVDIGYDGPVRAEPFNAKLNALEDDEAVAATAKAMKAAMALVDPLS